MNAPIVLFVYNRLQHTQQTINALRNSIGANVSPLIIFSDAAKDDCQRECVENVRRFCKSVDGFASVTIIERESNYGLARNIIEGVGQIFESYNQVIVLEDDLFVSQGFIEYMNAALSFYNDKGVFSISGYSPNIDIPSDYAYSTYAMHRNCSWGWATWKNKWESVDWNVSDFDSFIRNAKARMCFNGCGCDLTPMLLRWRIGEIKSWSIRFCYSAFKCGEPSIYPVHSLVRNNGVDGSGTNMRSSNRYETSVVDNIDLNSFTDNIVPNNNITRLFRKIYDTSIIRRFINCYKRYKYLIFKL